MTATPIPRTLTMTAYGDLDVSLLDEKPAGRARRSRPRTVPLERLDEVVAAVERVRWPAAPRSTGSARWSRSRRTPISPPPRSASPALEITSARRVGLVHGRMKGAGEGPGRWRPSPAAAIDLLVATTVIEVGVDVPDGDDHGDRACRALRPRPAAPAARPHRPRRQAVDLPAALRTAAGRDRQGAALDPARDRRRLSASPRRICACAAAASCSAPGRAACRPCAWSISPPHAELIAIAHDDARLVLNRDPELASPRGQALRTLLYLFRRDEAVQYLRAG